MGIQIGRSPVKDIYVNNKRVKHLYLEKNLVYSLTVWIVFMLDNGIQSLKVSVTGVNGAENSYVLDKTTSLGCPFGAFVRVDAVPKPGFSLKSNTKEFTVTEERTVNYETTANSYWVNFNEKYNGTEYGGSVGAKLGTFQYSTDNVNWSGAISNEPWDGDTKFTYGSLIYIRNVNPAAGFRFDSVTFNGGGISASGGVYRIQVAETNEIDINFAASSASSSFTTDYALTTRSNSITRNAFDVSFSLDLDLNSCSAGTILGYVPAQFRPSSNKTYTTTWRVQTGYISETTTAVVTIRTDGGYFSDKASDGTGSSGGGGKWGGAIAWTTKLTISGSYSVV